MAASAVSAGQLLSQREATAYPLCHGGEFQDVEGLVVHGRALVDVDDHAGFASTTEEALQVVSQLTFPEGNVLKEPDGGNRQTRYRLVEQIIFELPSSA